MVKNVVLYSCGMENTIKLENHISIYVYFIYFSGFSSVESFADGVAVGWKITKWGAAGLDPVIVADFLAEAGIFEFDARLAAFTRGSE